MREGASKGTQAKVIQGSAAGRGGDVEAEDEVDLAVTFAALDEGVFGDGEEVAGGGVQAEFFLDFTDEGLSAGLVELDVSAGEVGAAAFGGFAEEDVAIADADAAGDGLDVGVFVGHSVEVWKFGGLEVWRSPRG